MNPYTRKTKSTFALVLLLLLATATGCASAFGTLAYMWKGDQIDPPCDKMKGKVAIVCRPRASTSYQYGDVANELAKSLNSRISAGIKKPKECQVVKQQAVEEYCDNMEAEMNFVEIGKAVGADQVIAIDILSFNHIAGTEVLQGKADVGVQLIDVRTGDVLYEPEYLDEYVYPRNYKVSSTEINEYKFRHKFIGRLANYISKQFIPYSRFDNDL
ncbi:MAG: hypothetical protein Q4D38_03790 [Planctomycetia bacterium]|nr:hypothetical protein [Planctomycetia bacterium]